MSAMAMKRHCNTCDGTTPKPWMGNQQRWISVYPEEPQEGAWPRRLGATVDVAEALTGDYCSVPCLLAVAERYR